VSVTPQGVPDKGVPQGVPNKGVPQGVPDKGVPQGVPDNGVPQRVPQDVRDTGTPDHGPRGAAPMRAMATAEPGRAPREPAPSPRPDLAAMASAQATPARDPTPGGAAQSPPNDPPGVVAPSAGSGAPSGTSASAAPWPVAAATRAASGEAPSRRRRIVRVALMLVLPLGLVIGFGVFVHAALDLARPQPDETDGIVVLTGGSERVATGFRLLAEGHARRLLISGAHPGANLPEIAAAAGIDPAPFAGRVAVGHAAASTRGNAAEAAAWARAEEMRSLRIVTAGYHMPRAMVELRRAMPALRLVEHPVPSAALRAPGALWRPQVWALLAGEYARYLGAWAGLSGAFVPRRESHAT
jgi:uncharacterized SAM-binding protein YcdF (DUF218 family)